jgi:hypothetical protein
MDFVGHLWDTIWFFFWIFVVIAYLSVNFSVIKDIFCDNTLGGGYKAFWVIAFVFIPFLTVLAYLIFRGRGMTERELAARGQAQGATAAYVKNLAGSGSADEITKAKALLDDGTITQAEFDTIKAHALA